MTILRRIFIVLWVLCALWVGTCTVLALKNPTSDSLGFWAFMCLPVLGGLVALQFILLGSPWPMAAWRDKD